MPKRMTVHFYRLFPILMILLIVISFGFLTACSGSQSTTAAEAKAVSQETAAVTAEKTFTPDELAAFDGKGGNKAYIAVDGIVYDVTAVSQWGSKLHAGKFQAGKDYSEEIKSAPHGVDKLLTAVKVGILAK